MIGFGGPLRFRMGFWGWPLALGLMMGLKETIRSIDELEFSGWIWVGRAGDVGVS